VVEITGGSALVTLPGIELATVGQWELGSGRAVFTRHDMAAAVGALECPAVRRPVLKLGHNEPSPDGQKRWDGEPAIGWIENMALTDSGTMIVGDYSGVPSWLGQIMSSAYPDRSIEATRGFVCQIGHTHDFVITAVALLGVTPPGVGVLKSITDVKALYGVTAEAVTSNETITVVQSSRLELPAMPEPITITAAVTSEDVRREYYEDANPYWWICEMVMDPAQLIVMDESSGDMYRVPFTIEGKSITFADPIEVDVEYVDSPPESETVPVASARVIFAGAAERTFRQSLPTPDERQATAAATPQSTPQTSPEPDGSGPSGSPAPAPQLPAQPVTAAHAASRIHGAPIHMKGNNVEFTEAQLAELRKTLGLAEDAELTPEGILSASGVLAQHKAEIAAAGPNTVVIDASVWTDMQNRITRGEEARRVQLEADRDATLTAAMQAGKFPPARLQQWQRAWQADPEGTREIVASLTRGIVPTQEIGYPGDPDAYHSGEFDSLFPPSASGQNGN
jgi:hypothetical protein